MDNNPTQPKINLNPPTNQAPVNPGSPVSKKRPVLHYVIAGIVALIIIIALIAAIGGGSSKNTANNSTSKAPVATKTQPQANNPSNAGTASKINDWYNQYGSIFTTLANDLTTFSNDASAGSMSGAAKDCQQLGTDVKTAQGQPAIPDSATEQHWSAALSHLSSGAQDCVQGINNSDSSLIKQAGDEFNQADTELTATANAVKQVNG